MKYTLFQMKDILNNPKTTLRDAACIIGELMHENSEQDNKLRRIKEHLAAFRKWKDEEQKVTVDESNMVHNSPDFQKKQGETLFKIHKELE